MKVVWKDFKGELKNVSTALRPAGAASVAKACRFENGMLKAAEEFVESSINRTGGVHTVLPISATENLPLAFECDVIPRARIGQYSYAFWTSTNREGAVNYKGLFMGRHEPLSLSTEAEGFQIGAVGGESTFPVAGTYFKTGPYTRPINLTGVGYAVAGSTSGGTTSLITYMLVRVRHWAGHFNHPLIGPSSLSYVPPFMEYSVPSPNILVQGTVYDGQGVGLPLHSNFYDPSDDGDFTHVHVFRLESGPNGSTFQQIKVCPGTSSGPDVTSSPTIHLRANLCSSGGNNYIWDVDSPLVVTGRDAGFRGSPISENFTSPPEYTDGCNKLSNGSLVQWWERTVYISNPLFFTSDWPYVYEFPATVRYVVPLSTGAVVFTTNGVFILSGSGPAAYTKREVVNGEVNISRKGIVAIQNGVSYPSKNGLILMDTSGQWRNLTAGAYTTSEWMAKQPYNFHAAVIRGRYIAIREGGHGGINVNLSTGQVSDWDVRNFDSFGGITANPLSHIATYTGEDVYGEELRVIPFYGDTATNNYVFTLQSGTNYDVSDAALDNFTWTSLKTKLPEASWLGYARITADWDKTLGVTITLEIHGYYTDDDGVAGEWSNAAAPLVIDGDGIKRVPTDPTLGKIRFEWVAVTITGKVPVHLVELSDSRDALTETYG